MIILAAIFFVLAGLCCLVAVFTWNKDLFQFSLAFACVGIVVTVFGAFLRLFA